MKEEVRERGEDVGIEELEAEQTSGESAHDNGAKKECR